MKYIFSLFFSVTFPPIFVQLHPFTPTAITILLTHTPTSTPHPCVYIWNPWGERSVDKNRESSESHFHAIKLRLFKMRLFKPRLFKPRLFKSRLFMPRLFKPRLFKSRLFKSRLFKPILFMPRLFKLRLFKPKLFKSRLFKPR